MRIEAVEIVMRLLEAAGATTGKEVLYAKTTIESDRDQIKKLSIGYSDEVSVFVNGKILLSRPKRAEFR